jgi:hypothetical protein
MSVRISNEFGKFHILNRQVYDVLVRLAQDWVRRTGRDKVSIDLLYEVARWEIALGITPINPDDYKLNNNFRAYYSRMIMHFEHDLVGMFQLRKAPDADAWLQDYISRGGRP